MEKARAFFYSPSVREQFEDVAGTSASVYLNQVLSLVALDKNLQECSLTSILVSAIRAASLRLSLDKSQGLAWIIPYKGQATFVIGARGYYQLAMRTNKYRYLNVFKVYEGQQIDEDQITGLMKINGAKTSNHIVGYGLAFELFTGFAKMYYMTVEELEDHAKRYSPSYNHASSPWKDPREKPKMMEKTVMRLGLSKYGVFDETTRNLIDEIEQGEFREIEELPEENMIDMGAAEPEERKSAAELMGDLGYSAPRQATHTLTPDEKLAEIAAHYPGVKPADIRIRINDSSAVDMETSSVDDLASWLGFYVSHKKGNNTEEAIQSADYDFRDWQAQQAQTAMPL